MGCQLGPARQPLGPTPWTLELGVGVRTPGWGGGQPARFSSRPLDPIPQGFGSGWPAGEEPVGQPTRMPRMVANTRCRTERAFCASCLLNREGFPCTRHPLLPERRGIQSSPSPSTVRTSSGWTTGAYDGGCICAIGGGEAADLRARADTHTSRCAASLCVRCTRSTHGHYGWHTWACEYLGEIQGWCSECSPSRSRGRCVCGLHGASCSIAGAASTYCPSPPRAFLHPCKLSLECRFPASGRRCLCRIPAPLPTDGLQRGALAPRAPSSFCSASTCAPAQWSTSAAATRW